MSRSTGSIARSTAFGSNASGEPSTEAAVIRLSPAPAPVDPPRIASGARCSDSRSTRSSTPDTWRRRWRYPSRRTGLRTVRSVGRIRSMKRARPPVVRMSAVRAWKSIR